MMFSGSFKGSVLAILRADSFANTIRKNALAGGCNCSRANFIGSVLGALYGIGGERGIPLEWLEKTDKGKETLELALQRVAASAVAGK